LTGADDHLTESFVGTGAGDRRQFESEACHFGQVSRERDQWTDTLGGRSRDGELVEYFVGDERFDIGRHDLSEVEQIGRPGHFAVFEIWRDQPAFDGRDAAIQKTLLAALEPIRVAGYDQRPYKTLTLGNGAAKPDSQAVYVISHVDVAPNLPGPPPGPLLRTLAEASRKEPGNVRFDVVQHTMRANHYTVVEGWRNLQAFDAHVAAAHTKQYRDALQPMTGSPLDERIYKAIE